MADGVVDKQVYSKYCKDIIHFASWMHENEVAWFTDYGKATYEVLQRNQRVDQLKWRTMVSRVRKKLKG